jgi:hypothetical protein
MSWLTPQSPSLAATLTDWFGAALIAATLILVSGLAIRYLKTPRLKRLRPAFRGLVLTGIILQVLSLTGAIWFSLELQNLNRAQNHLAVSAEQNALRLAAVSTRETTKLRLALAAAGSAQQALQDENQDLKQSLGEANSELAALQAKTGTVANHTIQRRLKVSDRLALVAALMPFAKQKVQIFSIAGDVEGKNYRDDFVRVFERAGWDHEGTSGVVQAAFDVDPIGVTIILHQVDASHGHTNKAINALIATLKNLDLFQGGGVFISDQVPDGTVKVAIGKKGPQVASRAGPTKASLIGSLGGYH